MDLSQYQSTKETNNFARLSRLLVDICAGILRKVLDKRIPLRTFHTSSASLKPRLIGHLNSKQKQILYPPRTIFRGSYDEFDISLLYVLLREAGNIVPPKNGWGKVPNLTDRSLAANIERIHICKNDHYSHVLKAAISDADLEVIWNEISLAVEELEINLLPGQTYFTDSVAKLRTEPLDRETEESYVEKWRNDSKAVQAEVTELRTQVELIKSISETSHADIVEAKADIRSNSEKVTADIIDLRREVEQVALTSEGNNDQIKAEIAELRTEVEMGKCTSETLHADIEEAKADIRSNNEQITADIVDLRREVEQVAVRSADKNEQVSTDLRRTVDQVKVDAQENNQEVKAEIIYLRKRVEQVTAGTTTLKTEINEISRENVRESEESSDRLKNIRGNAFGLIEDHRNDQSFVTSNAVESGLKKLQDYGIVIYKGIPGEGKTTNAIEVMKRVYDNDNEYVILELSDVTRWNETVNIDTKTLVLLDDLLGATNCNESILNQGNKYWKNMHACIKKGNVKVIATVRSNIVTENRAELEKYTLFNSEHFVDLSGQHEMAASDKKKIFTKYCEIYGLSICRDHEEENYKTEKILSKSVPVYIHYETVAQIINTRTIMGFPQTCFLFCADRKYTRLGLAFFKHPSEKLVDEMDKKRKSSDPNEQIQFCVLSYMVLNNRKINLKKYNKSLMDKIQETVIPMLPNKTRLEQIEDALCDMKDKYIIQIAAEDIYLYKHETVHDAVTLSLSKCNMELLLDLCDWNFLQEFVRSEDYPKKENEIILRVRPKFYEILCKRVFAKIEGGANCNVTNNGPCYDVVAHPIMKDGKFLECLGNIAEATDEYSTLITENCRDLFYCSVMMSNCTVMNFLYSLNLTRPFLTDIFIHRCLLRSCFYGLIESVEWFLKKNKIIQISDQNGSLSQVTVPLIPHEDIIERLHVAVKWWRSNKIVEVILKSRKDITLSEIQKIFSLACCLGQLDTMEFILEMKNDRESYKDLYSLHYDDHLTFLHMTAYLCRLNVFKKLTELGLSLTAKTKEGASVLQVAMIRYITSSLYRPDTSTHYEFLKIKMGSLLRYISDLNCTFKMKDELELLEFITDQREVNVNELDSAIDSADNTLAHYGVIRHSLIEFLLRKRPQVFAVANKHGMLPLHVAIFLGQSDIFMLIHTCLKTKMPSVLEFHEMSLLKVLSDGKRFRRYAQRGQNLVKVRPIFVSPMTDTLKELTGDNFPVCVGSEEQYKIINDLLTV